jgi:hypothetical protein
MKGVASLSPLTKHKTRLDEQTASHVCICSFVCVLRRKVLVKWIHAMNSRMKPVATILTILKRADFRVHLAQGCVFRVHAIECVHVFHAITTSATLESFLPHAFVENSVPASRSGGGFSGMHALSSFSHSQGRVACESLSS